MTSFFYSWEKNTVFGVARKSFDPSYFVTALTFPKKSELPKTHKQHFAMGIKVSWFFLSCGKGLIFGTKRVISRKVNKIWFFTVRESSWRLRVKSRVNWTIPGLKWKFDGFFPQHSVSESFSVLIKHGTFGKKIDTDKQRRSCFKTSPKIENSW